MDINSISDAAPALGGLVGALVSAAGYVRGSTQMRNHLKQDAEVAAILPAGATRDRLLKYIEDQVEQLIEYETVATRNWPILVFSVAAITALGAGTVAFVQHGTWWSYVLAIVTAWFLVVFAYGIWDTGQKVRRDEDGNRISSAGQP